jgi:hypothetical protein
MVLYLWHSLVRSKRHSSRRSGCAAGTRALTRFRPRLELLEDRTVPSTFTVTNTTVHEERGLLSKRFGFRSGRLLRFLVVGAHNLPPATPSSRQPRSAPQ